MKEFMDKEYQTPYRWKLDLQLFAEDTDDNSDDDNDDNGGNDKPFATFKTKEELNKRLDRATRKGQKELATSLGFDSIEALQAALNKDKKDDKDKSKQSGDDTDVDSRIEEKLQEQNEKTFKRLLAAEVKVLANELGFADWEDAHALADLSKVKEDDKGNLTGVKEALEELLKKKPHLGKQKSGTGAFGANVGGGTGGSDKKDRLERMKKLAQDTGTATTAANDPWKR
jgi:hypothetical protein